MFLFAKFYFPFDHNKQKRNHLFHITSKRINLQHKEALPLKRFCMLLFKSNKVVVLVAVFRFLVNHHFITFPFQSIIFTILSYHLQLTTHFFRHRVSRKEIHNVTAYCSYVCACPKSGACYSVVVVCLYKCVTHLFFVHFFIQIRPLVFSFELFYIVISGPLIAEFAVWALLIVEGRTATYSC